MTMLPSKPETPEPATHITIAHNHFYSGHGMSIGSETNGGVSNVVVSDLTIDGADNGLRIKSDASRGGLVQRVSYKDVCIRDVKNPITISPFYTPASGTLVPTYQEIAVRECARCFTRQSRVDWDRCAASSSSAHGRRLHRSSGCQGNTYRSRALSLRGREQVSFASARRRRDRHQERPGKRIVAAIGL